MEQSLSFLKNISHLTGEGQKPLSLEEVEEHVEIIFKELNSLPFNNNISDLKNKISIFLTHLKIIISSNDILNELSIHSLKILITEYLRFIAQIQYKYDIISKDDLFHLLIHTGSNIKKQKFTRKAQLRISYVLAFVYQFSFSQIGELKKSEIQTLIEIPSFQEGSSLSDNKEKSVLLHLIKDDFYKLFSESTDEEKMKMDTKSTKNFVTFIKRDLIETCQFLKIEKKFTLKSFYLNAS
jgi:hypothetical protein